MSDTEALVTKPKKPGVMDRLFGRSKQSEAFGRLSDEDEPGPQMEAISGGQVDPVARLQMVAESELGRSRADYDRTKDVLDLLVPAKDLKIAKAPCAALAESFKNQTMARQAVERAIAQARDGGNATANAKLLERAVSTLQGETTKGAGLVRKTGETFQSYKDSQVRAGVEGSMKKGYVQGAAVEKGIALAGKVVSIALAATPVTAAFAPVASAAAKGAGMAAHEYFVRKELGTEKGRSENEPLLMSGASDVYSPASKVAQIGIKAAGVAVDTFAPGASDGFELGADLLTGVMNAPGHAQTAAKMGHKAATLAGAHDTAGSLSDAHKTFGRFTPAGMDQARHDKLKSENGGQGVQNFLDDFDGDAFPDQEWPADFG